MYQFFLYFSIKATYDPRDRSKVLEDVGAPELEEMVAKARKEVIERQVNLGLDVITDGEIERDNYIFHCARNFKGINMDSVTTKIIRDGTYDTFPNDNVNSQKYRWAADFTSIIIHRTTI